MNTSSEWESSARPRILVCTSSSQADAARELVDTLCRFSSARWSNFSSIDSEVELLLQLVSEEDLPAAVQQLETVRRTSDPVILVASIGLTASAHAALSEAGVHDFLSMPVDPGGLIGRACRALGLDRARASTDACRDRRYSSLESLVGSSRVFARQVERIPVFARCDANVLILGDTGTGKEICAQAIHYMSARAQGPWVAINCAAIPSDLIEAELFGHVRGAYTNAQSSRRGLVSEAEGGTLFLDEIDSMPLGGQGKLLRFLQEKEYRQVGCNKVLRADVRVIAASNRALMTLAERQAFRQDLLYRLNVLTMHLPALRDRRDDIAQLALHFLQLFARQWKKPAPSIAPAALRKLIAHDWPGNVRELRNVIERAVLLCSSGQIVHDDIEFDGSVGTDTLPAAAEESFREAKARVVEAFERRYIEQLLSDHGGNVTRAAQSARKNRRALFELMRKHRIVPDAFRAAARAAK